MAWTNDQRCLYQRWFFLFKRTYNPSFDIILDDTLRHNYIANENLSFLCYLEFYLGLHAKFLFCCFCLNCPNSKCFNLFCFVKLCLCYDLSIMNDSWLGVHCLFIFFATMHNAYCVNCELWHINVGVWHKLHHQLGVWSLNYHRCDSHGVGESLIIDFLVLNHKIFLNWGLVY